MAIKTPVRATLDGSNVTGLSEYQSGDFIGLSHGGIGASLSIGTAGQVLKVNSGASALEFGSVTATLDIDTANDLTGSTLAATDLLLASDGGTEGKITLSQLDTLFKSTTQTLTNKTISGSNNTITITESDISDLGSYLTSVAINDITDVTISSASNGQVLKYNGSAWVNDTDSGGIALTDLSIGTEASASGDGAIAYNDGSGVFTYTPPDLSSLAPLASPTLTGTPASTTASAGTNTTQIATTAFVATAVANLADSAPSTLDTLNELAAALGDDANFAATTATSLGEKLAKASNLSDLADAGTARTNLGLGTVATTAASAYATAAQGTKADTAVQPAAIANIVETTDTLDALTGVDITTAAPTSGQILSFNGTNFVPADPSGGGISWQAVKTANFNAAAGEGYFVNTTNNVITATLPASPTLGDEITFIDYAGTSDTNTITIARNSKPIAGAASDLTVTVERAGFTLVFVDNTQGWLFKDK
jgi:hypothetical protein